MNKGKRTITTGNGATFRLVLVGAAVFALAMLPVLPLQFNGLLPAWTGPTPADLARLFRSKESKEITAGSPLHPGSAPDAPGPVQIMEQAVSELNGLIARAPGDPALQNRLGVVYAGLGELESAQSHLQQAVELARLGLAESGQRLERLKKQGKTAAAAALVLEQARLHDELSASHSHLVHIYELLGNKGRALAETDLLNREGIVAGVISQIQTNTGRLKDQLPLQEQEGRQPHHCLSQVVSRLLSKAQLFMDRRQINEAMQEFKNVIAIDPNSACAHSNLGVIAAMGSNHEEAVNEFTQAVRLDPHDSLSENNLGLALQATGKWAQAKEHFERAIANNPKLVDAAINLANLYAAGQSYQYASQVLKQAVMSNPHSACAHNNLAALLCLQGQPEQAVGEFHQALAIAPDLVSAHYGLGLALLKTGNYRACVAAFKQALLLNPELVGVHEKIEQAIRKLSSIEG